MRYSCAALSAEDKAIQQQWLEQSVQLMYQHHVKEGNEVVIFYSPIAKFGFVQLVKNS
jgi:hypothetical protein